MMVLRFFFLPIGCLLLSAQFAIASADEKVLHEWRFDESVQWNNWTPNPDIQGVSFANGVTFDATGTDPQVTGPLFSLGKASNQQWVVIDLECSGQGQGELFYTNTEEGQYGGLRQQWTAGVVIPSAGRRHIAVWPFWANLGKIIRLRFDPPPGLRYRLYSIRIVELEATAGEPNWTFSAEADSWRVLLGAELYRRSMLQIRATGPQAVMVTAVAPFDAARKSILALDVDSPIERIVSFHWAGDKHQGLYGETITLPPGGKLSLDLRQFPEWAGTISHLAFGFGSADSDQLTIRSLSVSDNDPKRPAIRLRHLTFVKPINRVGTEAVACAFLEHCGGPAVPAGPVPVRCDSACEMAAAELHIPAIAQGGQTQLCIPLRLKIAGDTTIELSVADHTFRRTLRVDEPLTPRRTQIKPEDYDVPPPRPVISRYQLGVYYFPGWSADQLDRWKKQEHFPERDPVLGWYEGLPEVADWHIKWAVENGISFFVYDWYWRDGKEALTAGLNEGFLKARYQDRMKFALMWANHPPFAAHTPEQLLMVADYWIEHYLRRPNYLIVDGKPYVSFFTPGQLISDLGSHEKVREALNAVRQRVTAAGLPGLHIGACGGWDRPGMEVLKECGFDSVTAYNYVVTGATTKQSPYREFLRGHEAIWKSSQNAGVLPYIPLLTVGWDPVPWHGPYSERRVGRRARDFAEALRRLKGNLDGTPRKMAILEAWNEWGEGSYLEPNNEFGFADLEAIRTIFAQPGDWPTNVGPDDFGFHGKYDLRQKR